MSHLQVRSASTKSRSNSERRKSSFSIMRSTPFFLSRQNSYNPSVKTKLCHDHHHEGDEWMQQTSTTLDDSLQTRRKSREYDTDATSPTSQYCQYCNPKKESHTKTTRLTIRKKDGYERAAFQRERRVAKSLSVVVGGFIICWLPFFIVYLIQPFCESCFFHPTLLSCLVWLGWVNSAINPLIYALNNKDFKKAFIRLTIDKCRCWRKPRKGHDPQQFM